MLDLGNLEKYKENNRIEAKKATGGLPESLWETYSAFANTMGGVILLGVEEHRDKSLHPIDLPDPQQLMEEVWAVLGEPGRVSRNILTERDISLRLVGGHTIVVIHVPRARRAYRPVFIGGDPISGTYRRNGEGDYRCTPEEVRAMLREAAREATDMKIIESMDMGVFDHYSVQRYRRRMEEHRPGHVWEELDDEDFLFKLGAAVRGADGMNHPTAAGLLMLGHAYETVRVYPDYCLTYRDEPRGYELCSSSGDWSGDLFDFYTTVYEHISRALPETQDGYTVHNALSEALANCLINADYSGTQGLTVTLTETEITFSNPGSFLIDPDQAKSGGVSDPRNRELIRMFGLIGIGRSTGSGIPSIYRIWDSQGWEPPMITEGVCPPRTTLSLSMAGAEVSEREDRRKLPKLRRATIVEYLTDHVTAREEELSQLLEIDGRMVRSLIGQLIREGIVVESAGVYRLRSKPRQ